MNILKKLVLTASKRGRQRRAEIFRRNFEIDENTKLLDIGSESGENIHLVLSSTKILPENVYIADINGIDLQHGQEKFGFQPVLIQETLELPFEDNFFDIVYCSSVIEHVTVPKEIVWEIVSEKEFFEAAWKKQQFLAKEINRIGRQYFVQTPASGFPIESHTWLPFFDRFSRPQQIKAMNLTNKFWVKPAIPDFNLLNEKQMAELFPDARIVFERKIGLVKSIMAIKSLR